MSGPMLAICGLEGEGVERGGEAGETNRYPKKVDLTPSGKLRCQIEGIEVFRVVGGGCESGIGLGEVRDVEQEHRQ